MRRGILITNQESSQRGLVSQVQETMALAIPGPGLAIHQNPATAYLASLSSDSRRTMAESLASIARMLRPELPANNQAAILAVEWHLLENAHVEAIRTKLAETLAPNTANKKLAALRGVLKKAWKLGLISREDYERTIDVETIKGERLLRGRDIPQGEVRSLFISCREDKSIVGIRDAALLALLCGGGMRRAEVANLTMADWQPDKCQVIVRRGKGNKDRETPLPDGTCRAIDAWLAVRGEAGPDDALICPMAKGNKILNRRMSTQAIWKALKTRAKKAGVAVLSPHDFRRTYIGDLLNAGVDLSTVQKLAGHSDPKITAQYDRRPAEVRRAAVNLLHVPF
jgi:integrase/recombinase XerD